MESKFFVVDESAIPADAIDFLVENAKLDADAMPKLHESKERLCHKAAMCIDGPMKGIVLWEDADSVLYGVPFDGAKYHYHYMRGPDGFEFKGWLGLPDD